MCQTEMSSGDVETVNVKQMVSPSPAWLHQNPPPPPLSRSSSSSCCLTSLWPVCTYNYWSWPSNTASTQQSATVLTGQHWSNHTTQQRHTGHWFYLFVFIYYYLFIFYLCAHALLWVHRVFFFQLYLKTDKLCRHYNIFSVLRVLCNKILYVIL